MTDFSHFSLKFFKSLSLVLFVLCEVAAQQRRKNTTKAFFYLCIGFIVLGVLLAGTYILRRLCPEGPRFAPIELDDIRIERLDDIESNLQNNINSLKTKLAYHRKKKTVVQTDRDIKARINERVDRFNERGVETYGADAWESGEVPAREVVTMTQKEIIGLKAETEEIVQTRQNEEKEDLWLLWNDMKSAGGRGAAGRAKTGGNTIGPYNPLMSTAAVAGAGVGTGMHMGGAAAGSFNGENGSVRSSGRQGRVTLYGDNQAAAAVGAAAAAGGMQNIAVAPGHIKPPPRNYNNKSNNTNTYTSTNQANKNNSSSSSNRFPTRQKTFNEKLAVGEQYSMDIPIHDHRINDNNKPSSKKSASASASGSAGGFKKNRRPSLEGKELLPKQPMQLTRPGTAGNQQRTASSSASPGPAMSITRSSISGLRPPPPSVPPPKGPNPYNARKDTTTAATANGGKHKAV